MGSTRPSATGAGRAWALDGLRAVGLVLVMAFHFGVGWLSGGFVGVDVFYVLSGYLITGLLLGEFRRRGTVSLGTFWLRRARRLLPALCIVVVAVSLLVRYAEPSGLFPDFRMDALSALFYFSNWFQIAASSNYFVANGPASPLTHTWSLAVEEQFYLAWPLVVLATMAVAGTVRRGVAALLALSTAGAVASAVEMGLLYRAGTNTTRVYFGTDTHAQSILVGSALACAMTLVQLRRGEPGMDAAARRRWSRWVLGVLGVAGVAVVAGGAVGLDGTGATTFRGGFFVVDVATAAVILAAVSSPGGRLPRILALRPLVWLGAISYGAYLWHYPVAVFLDTARTGQGGVSLLAIRSAATIGLATASYVLVERPIIDGTFWRSLKAVVPAASLMAATVAVVTVATVTPAVAQVRVRPTLSSDVRRSLAADGAFRGHPIRFMLVGDSIAETLGIGLAVDSVQRYGVDVVNKAVLGCDLDDLPAIVGGVVDQPESPCRWWRTLWAADAAQVHPDVVGILVGRWDITDHIDDGTEVDLTQPAWNTHLAGELDAAVTLFASRGAKVVLFTMPDIDALLEAPGSTRYPENSQVRIDDFNAIVRRVAAERRGSATLVDLNTIADPEGHFQMVIGGVTVRWPDGVHFAKTGGEWLEPRILPTVDRLGVAARAAEAQHHRPRRT